MAHLCWEKHGRIPPRHLSPMIEEPFYSSEELLGIVSANIRLPFDATEVIARIVDGSRFMAFKPLYGANLVCGWAHLHGEWVILLKSDWRRLRLNRIPHGYVCTCIYRISSHIHYNSFQAYPSALLQITTSFSSRNLTKPHNLFSSAT